MLSFVTLLRGGGIVGYLYGIYITIHKGVSIFYLKFFYFYNLCFELVIRLYKTLGYVFLIYQNLRLLFINKHSAQMLIMINIM